MKHLSVFNGIDAHVTAMMGILRDETDMNNAVIYKIGREGLDLIQRPDTDEDIQDFVWSSYKGVVTDSPVTYRYEGSPNPEGQMKSDLMDAPALEVRALA